MIESVVQFSLFLVNKPGILAQVCRQIAQAKVNIIAMTMMDSSEHGVLRLVASNPDKVRQALKELNLPMTEADVLVIELPNRTGALADVCAKLAGAHINISYSYCTTGARGGKTKAVFKVADAKKAIKLLTKRSPQNRDMKDKLRRPAILR